MSHFSCPLIYTNINCRIDRKGAFMETVKDIKDFKRFIELNRDKLYARAENANDIAIDDE